MEYFGLEEKVSLYDLEDVKIEGATATYNNEKRPYVYGPTPFAISCSVLRNGTRDISPPQVDRTPGELVSLMHCLMNEYPGSIVYPITTDGLSENNGTLNLLRVNQFISAIIKHSQFGKSKRVLEFFLHPKISPAISKAQLAGSDVSTSAFTGRLTGSISDKATNEIPRVLLWVKEKEVLLDNIKNKTIKTKKSMTIAARDLALLLSTGGCLVDTEKALEIDMLGLDATLERFHQERALLGALRIAAEKTTTLFDRLAAAIQIRDAARSSYAKRQEIEALGGDKSTTDSLTLATASTKLDVETAEKRVQKLEPLADAARIRFGREARTFIQQFPQRFSNAIDILVDTQIAAANHAAQALTESKNVTQQDAVENNQELDACLAQVSSGESNVASIVQEQLEQAPTKPSASPEDPPWAQPENDTSHVATQKNKATAAPASKAPSWVNEEADSIKK